MNHVHSETARQTDISFQPEEPVSLNRGSRTKLIRFIVGSSLFLFVGAAAKLSFISIIFFFVLFVLCLQRRLDPVDVLVIMLAVTPWMGPFRWFFDSGFNFDRGLILLAFAVLWSTYGPRHRIFLSNGLDFALYAFLTACALSALLSFMHRTPFRALLESLLIPCGYYLIAKNCVWRQELLPKLYLATSFAILGFGVLGLFEGVSKMDVLSYGEPELDVFRISGPMRMAEDYGLCMNFLLLFYLGLRCLRRELPIRRPRFPWITPLVGVLSCYFTLTRGVWLSLAAGWLVQLAKRNFRRFLVIAPPLALAGWAFFSWVLPSIGGEIWEKRVHNERTINARIATYQSALAMFGDKPIFGVGFAAFDETWERFPERYYKEYKDEPSVSSPHNIVMSLLAETGLVGTLAFAFFMFQAVRFSLGLAKGAQLPAQREYASFMLSAIVAYLVAGMGLHMIRNVDFPNKYFFMFLGVLSGMIDASRKRRIKSASAETNALSCGAAAA
jgi:hypothetical protein